MKANPRPKLTIEPTGFDRTLEALAIAGIVSLWVVVLLKYSTLPERIPTHFNFKNEVDGYGGKDTILLLPIIGSAIYILLSVVNKFPHFFNYPTTITEENASRQYQFATRLIRLLKAGIALTFLCIIFMTFEAIDGHNPLPGYLIFPMVIAFIFAPIIWYFIRAFRK